MMGSQDKRRVVRGYDGGPETVKINGQGNGDDGGQIGMKGGQRR